MSLNMTKQNIGFDILGMGNPGKYQLIVVKMRNRESNI